MWPAVPAFRSFGNIACPAGTKCELPYCIFSHDAVKQETTPSNVVARNAFANEPAAKRQKLSDTQDDTPSVTPRAVFTGLSASKDKAVVSSKGSECAPKASSKPTNDKSDADALPQSATRPVSPPPKASVAAATPASAGPVALMPRKLVKEPAIFTRRLTLLKMLHSFMKPLNDKIAKAVKAEIKAVHMDPNQLNKLAVDEEERIAKANPAVYENVLKQRLFKLKKMTPEEWVKERFEARAKERGLPPKKPPPKRVDTGLTPKQEVVFLSTLICPQDGLDAHGYVTTLPTTEELNEARSAQASADFWEVCDRCNTRFQVFPERREEDGALTTGGQCTHHWGKRIYPKRSKNAGPEPTTFSCCNEPVGSPGCTSYETHVYKISGPKRLSLVMPFIETSVNDLAPTDIAVCFDCEMGYTTHGLELMRLTAISWPHHKPLVDVLVRPIGHLLDVNTRFSGITTEQFLNAKPYDPADPKPKRNDLRIVESPYAARDLFLAHVTTTTPVLGHALENDLNTLRVIHPNIIDTVLLFPHRRGLPLRHGLRALAKEKLDLDIQQGGAAGHDSFEDAKTTGELIRFKVAEKWRQLKHDGWEVRDSGVYPPMPPGTPPPQMLPAPPMMPLAPMMAPDGNSGLKRKLEKEDGAAVEDEPLAKKQA
ncbi:RNA exonuclease-like protein Rex3 [Boeremia exigua]|uniref:RNA exonuclease-like protein Rex3 n=1 Tax=Boeremia exigua TaxID=749465 RepID=UPI001E8DB917|nr:RNA exonuclease-like protein Rex3 [Boeremia exigua]KAH6625311.1 RNA exonuclease-like protein Rex3 [Boeremia exigua]